MMAWWLSGGPAG